MNYSVLSMSELRDIALYLQSFNENIYPIEGVGLRTLKLL